MNTTYWEDIKQSLFNLLNNVLLQQGAYLNIPTGFTDKFGNDLSVLYPVIDESITSTPGQIFQSAFHNWNYESGVTNTPAPIIPSGVYINGVFTPKSPSIHFDYDNGRVIFDTPIPTTGIVQASFAIKEYSFLGPVNDKEAVHETQFVINDDVTGKKAFPADPSQVYLPAIFIEIEEATEQGFQFGGLHSTIPLIRINIISDKRSQVEQIASAIVNQSTRSFPIVSADKGPIFDAFNDLTQDYSFSNWITLSRNFAYIKSVKYNRFFRAIQEQKEPHIYGGVVSIEIIATRS